MSLINEALKKAQRARLEDQAVAEAIAPGGAVPKRRQARSANTMVLIGAGAVTLIVVSVVATVYFLGGDRTSAPAPVAKSSATPPTVGPTATPATAAPVASSSAPAATPTATPATAPAPVVNAPTPVVTPPLATPAAPPVTAAVATKPASPAPIASSVAPTAAPVPAPAAAAATLPAPPPATASRPAAPAPTANVPAVPAAPAAAAAAATLDPRIAAYVDGIRVTGVRASGNDSRVLMNDRVYRVNDIVERTLGVRLVKVAGDSLTFSDANGVTYVKHL
jgi:hypothetical protein